MMDMKGLFLVFHGFAPHNGISKKIYYQRDALQHAGAQVGLCYLARGPEGTLQRRVDDVVLDDYGCGLRAKIGKRIRYRSLLQYVRGERPDFIYVRYDHNASPVLIRLFSRLKRTGVRIAVEIPTYPYDSEYARSSWKRKARLSMDRCFRHILARSFDRIVTFTDEPVIFGVPTIRISNGIDFDKVPIKKYVNDTSCELHLVGVAQIHFWHGFDRVIEGLGRYYATPQARKVYFHIVGEGVPQELASLHGLVSRYGLEEYVLFHGALFGEQLDEVFDRCDLGIASLGRHRNGIDRIKTLKNREYAARGIPFVYSEQDDDFDGMPYVMKAPADDTPLDVNGLIEFYDHTDKDPSRIRATVEDRLSWDIQMRKVLDELFRHQPGTGPEGIAVGYKNRG